MHLFTVHLVVPVFVEQNWWSTTVNEVAGTDMSSHEPSQEKKDAFQNNILCGLCFDSLILLF